MINTNITSINSFSENMSKLTKNTKDLLAIANAFNEAVSGNEEYVVVDSSTKILSSANISNRLSRIEDTVAAFTQGKGIVETDDGTFRKIKVDTVSKPAKTVMDLPSVTTFGINPNWFFEALQYPRCVVKIDLKDKIDDDSDRVYVGRIIVSTSQDRLTPDMQDTILASSYEYGEMIDFLNDNFIEYKEDRDEVKLPLTYEKYSGRFQVIGTSLIKNESTDIDENWVYLSTIKYSTVNEDGIIKDSDNTLTVGDYLRFENSLYRVKDINQTEKRVVLEYSVGYENIGIYDYLEYYNAPFSEKIISVGIGIDEIDIVYVKGVNENYNLLSRDWSNPVIFRTNDLLYEDDSAKKFVNFYWDGVADFGRQWIAHAKEGHIPAYGSLTPNAPVLNKDDLRVVQINTQLNVTLDTKNYKKLTSEIASTKSNISSVRTTISANKDRLVKESNPDSRETIQNTINSDTEKMNNLTTQLSSLVEELNTMLNDAGAISYSPKYHIRGFFSIPDPRYTIDTENEKSGKQCIIGFETMYRYLHTDEAGTALNTFKYTDRTTNSSMSGTFTDWNLSVSQFLEKKYDKESDSYYWSKENIDGNTIVINQIDIPIRNGEKVEIKVRSISEAGYPYSPLKSDWSNSVIIDFPDNLTSDDSVTKILETVKSDMTAVTLQETLSSAGMYSHISDMNSQYKHSAENIQYTETITDVTTGTSTTNTIPVSEKIKSLTETMKVIASAIGITLDAYGNITSDSGIGTTFNSPSVEYSFKDGTKEVSGSFKIQTPYLDSNDKEKTNQTIIDFVDSSLLPYINKNIFEDEEI